MVATTVKNQNDAWKAGVARRVENVLNVLMAMGYTLRDKCMYLSPTTYLALISDHDNEGIETRGYISLQWQLPNHLFDINPSWDTLKFQDNFAAICDKKSGHTCFYVELMSGDESPIIYDKNFFELGLVPTKYLPPEFRERSLTAEWNF